MQQQDPNHGSEGESGLRRIRVGGEADPGNAADEARSDAGYGTFGTGSQEPAADGASSISTGDERTWSMLAHLSTLANAAVYLITLGTMGIPLLGPIAALVIWLVYKDRSQRVSFHALQSLWYQLAWLVIIGAGWIVTVVLSFVLVGLLLIPLMLVLPLVPLVHQCYAAYKVNQGVDYRYPIIADMVDRNRRFR